MKVYHQIISCLLLLALTIKEGLSLECYSCNSFIHKENCDKIMPDTPKVNCTVPEKICRKVEQHINYNDQDHIRVFRQCAERGTPNTCESRTGTYRFKSWYCHCEGPLCNGSGHLLVPLATMLVPLIAAVYEVRKYL